MNGQSYFYKISKGKMCLSTEKEEAYPLSLPFRKSINTVYHNLSPSIGGASANDRKYKAVKVIKYGYSSSCITFTAMWLYVLLTKYVVACFIQHIQSKSLSIECKTSFIVTQIALHISSLPISTV